MFLPWEYCVRNLSRRPVRTGLTLSALSIVILLVFVVVGFIRGLERSLRVTGDPDVVLISSINSEANLESSAIPAQTPALIAASIDGTQSRYGITYASPEMYLGTRVTANQKEPAPGLIRAVTTSAPLVRRSVRIVEGHWPSRSEVLVGRLAAAKLGLTEQDMAIGQTLTFEGQTWKISGHFSADGAAYESEIWCNLADFQSATKRQDLSLVALLLKPGSTTGEVSLFCKERMDLELKAVRETDFYAELQQHYRPVRLLAWTVVIMVSGAGVFAGLNMMYGAVAGRIREIATLQAIGYRRRAILFSLIQEGVLLSAAGSLISGFIALAVLNGLAVRFTMGAFTLRIDGPAILMGCGVGVILGVFGALPPALKALRASVAVSLKAV